MRWLLRSIVVPGALVLAALALVAAATASAGGERTNRRAAQRDAARLLAHVILPANAAPSAGEPENDRRFLSRPGQVPAEVNLVDLHRWWTVPEDESVVSAFVNTHQPRGTRGVTGSVGDGVDFTTESLTFQLPSVGRSLGTRWLVVAMVTLPGDRTGVRIDAEVQWLIPRPAGERVPFAARLLEVTVTRPGRPPVSDVTVTRAAEARRMASLIDALQTSSPARLTARAGPTIPSPRSRSARNRPRPPVGCSPEPRRSSSRARAAAAANR